MTSDKMRNITNGAPSLDRNDRLKFWSAITAPPPRKYD
jgi:hypothetical protein